MCGAGLPVQEEWQAHQQGLEEEVCDTAGRWPTHLPSQSTRTFTAMRSLLGSQTVDHCLLSKLSGFTF